VDIEIQPDLTLNEQGLL